MLTICIPVFLVTLFIAVSWYEVYILTSCLICTWPNWHMWLFMWHVKGILDFGIAWQWHVSCHIILMVLSMTMSLVSYNADANDITWPKCHVASHFNHLDLRKAMMPFTTPTASFDANASTNSITWPKRHVEPHFDCLDLKYAFVPLTMLMALHDTDAGSSCFTWPHFDCLDIRNEIVPLTMLESSCDDHVMMHLISIILT